MRQIGWCLMQMSDRLSIAGEIFRSVRCGHERKPFRTTLDGSHLTTFSRKYASGSGGAYPDTLSV